MKNTSKVDEPQLRKLDHSSKCVTCQKAMLNLRQAILEKGIVICADKGHGKTNTLQVLFSSMNDFTPIVIDYASQHCFKLGQRFQVKFMNESYWLKPKIHIDKPIILDFSQTTKSIAGEIIRDIIKREYYIRVKAVIEGFREGKTREQILEAFKWQIYATEESQDLIGRYLKDDDDLKTAVSCGRNYRVSFCFLTQRLADLNTQLVERCCYLIGKQLGDNNLRKVSRVLGLPRKQVKFIETLQKGEFVFYNGERIERIKFPKFEGYGKAYEVQRRIVKRKSRGLWRKMKDAFSSKQEESTEEEREDTETYDSEKEFEEEEKEWDEWLTSEEEWEEDSEW